LAKFHFSDIVNFYRISKYNIKAYSVVSGVVLSVVLQTKWIHAEWINNVFIVSKPVDCIGKDSSLWTIPLFEH